VTAWGVETNRHLAEAARARGADIRDGDPVGHLAGLEESTVGAVTAFGVVDHLGPEAVVALVDAALVALRPGGVLIVEVPNVTALDVGAAGVWTDPARRPIHPEFLEFLMVARGYAEVELRWRQPVDEALWVQADDLAGADAARAQAVAGRFNRLLAGPRVVAVIARKAGAPPT
jgi:SAM-dependent methyltransferase